MSAFDLYPEEAAAKLERGASVDLNAGAGFFEGALTAPLMGAAKGLVVEPGRAVNFALSAMPAAIDAAFGTSTQDWWFEHMSLERASRKVTPNPRETGTAGQILHSLFDVGSQALTVGPAGVGILKTVGKSIEGVEEGLDTGTAMKKGAIEGASSALGVALPLAIPPVVGSKIPALVQQLGYGVASNVPMGIAQRALTSDVLSKAGYKDMAEQYKALDEGGLMTDFVLGLAFGGFGHVLHGKEWAGGVKPSDIDAALTARNAYHIEVDTAPGLARNGETRDAHVESVLKATEDLIAGRAVDVGETLHAADFEPNPAIDKARADAVAQTEKVSAPITRAADELQKIDEAAEKRVMDKPVTTDDAVVKAFPELNLLDVPVKLKDGTEAIVTFNPEKFAGQSATVGFMVKNAAGDKLGGGGLNPKDANAGTWKADYFTNEEHRRKGVLTAALDAFENLTGQKVSKGQTLEESAVAFWSNRESRGAKPSPERAAQIETALKTEGIDSTPETVQTVHLIAQARELDPAAVDAIPLTLSDAAYLTKVKEVVDGNKKTAAAGEAGKGAPGEGPRPGAGDAGQRQEGGQAAGRQGGKAQPGGEDTRHVDEAVMRDAEALVATKPDMLVMLDDGTELPAHQAFAKADEVIAQAQNDAKAFEAAVLCATRRGG